MATYTFEERKYKEKIEKETSLFASVHFPGHTEIKVEQDIFKEWFVTILQDDIKLFFKRFSGWSKCIRYFEDHNQTAPGTVQQIGMF